MGARNRDRQIIGVLSNNPPRLEKTYVGEITVNVISPFFTFNSQ